MLIPYPDNHLPTVPINVLVSGMSFHCIGLSKQMLAPVFRAGSCLTSE